MDLSISREVYYVVASICLGLITVFLCWALYEIARLVKRANHVVDEADTKIHELEASARGLLEKVTNLTSYASLFGEGVKTVMGYVQAKKGIDLDEMDDEEGDEPEKKKRGRK